MNDRLTQTAMAVAALAQKHGIAEAEGIARSLLEPAGQAVIVSSDTSMAQVFRDAVLPGVAMINWENLVGDAGAMTCPLLVAVFRCGQYLSADEVSSIEQAFFPRPAGTYAFVFTGATMLDAAELDMVERSSWRLLVPEPKPRWAQQDLTDYGIFLWDTAGAGDELAKGFEHAADAIRSLGRKEESRGALAALSLGAAIRKIRSTLEERSAKSTSSGGDREERTFREAQKQFRTLRRRLIRNAESESLVFSRTLDTSVLRLRNDLLAGLSHALRGGPGRSLSAPAHAQLRHNLQNYLGAAVNQWMTSTKAQISTGVDEIVGEARRMLATADWTVVNRTAEKQGRAAAWPERVLNRLSAARDVAPVDPVLGPYGNEPQPGQPNTSLALGGAGLVFTLGLVAGPIPAIISSILLGAAGLRMYQEGGIREYERYGRGIILGATEHMSVQIEERATASLNRYRTMIEEELNAVDTILAESLVQRDSDMVPDAGDLAVLDALQNSVIEQSQSVGLK